MIAQTVSSDRRCDFPSWRVESLTVIKTAVDWACQENLPVLLASTTGETAELLLDCLGGRSIRLMILTHDPRRACAKTRFNEEIKRRIQALGYCFVEDHVKWMPSISVTRFIEKLFDFSVLHPKWRKWERDYGIGGKVCFIMAQKATKLGFLRKSESCVCIAGHRTGADTALVIGTSDFECERRLICPPGSQK
jgi:hypothetical protein